MSIPRSVELDGLALFGNTGVNPELVADARPESIGREQIPMHNERAFRLRVERAEPRKQSVGVSVRRETFERDEKQRIRLLELQRPRGKSKGKGKGKGGGG